MQKVSSGRMFRDIGIMVALLATFALGYLIGLACTLWEERTA